MKGLSERKASESNVKRIQVKDIVKEVEDHLKTYSLAGMDISCSLRSDDVSICDILIERNKLGDDAALHFDTKDVFFLGFTVNGSRPYEYGKTGKITHDIPGSTFLWYDSGYIDFGVAYSLTVIKIGYWALKACPDGNCQGRAFAWEQHDGDVFVTEWMGTGIKNWENASSIAFERVARSTYLPPPGAGHVYTEDDLGIALAIPIPKIFTMFSSFSKEQLFSKSHSKGAFNFGRILRSHKNLNSSNIRHQQCQYCRAIVHTVQSDGGGGRAALEADAFLAAGDELCICTIEMSRKTIIMLQILGLLISIFIRSSYKYKLCATAFICLR
ncbi:retrovirus-related pol polyprotein from transposon TNT 1-94 [Tanacetum coccineum]